MKSAFKKVNFFKCRRNMLFAMLVFVPLLIGSGILFNSEKISLFDQITVYVQTENGTQEIRCQYDEDTEKYYFFLPSYASDNLKISIPENVSFELDGQVVENQGIITRITYSHEYNAGFYSKSGELIEGSKLVIMCSGPISSVFITTESGTLDNIHKNKENKEEGDIAIYRSDGSLDCSGSLEYIKGRGNSTWDLSKKPYNLRLTIEADLLGMGKGANWALLANHSDYLHIRNGIAFDMAKSLGISFTPDSSYVDLYINNEYRGLYQLTEKVEVGENRVEISDIEEETGRLNVLSLSRYPEAEKVRMKGVNIPNNPSDITGGYLLTMDILSRYENHTSGFITAKGQPVGIESPKYASMEQVEYISKGVQEAEDALFANDGINPNTGKAFTEYIDLDSWVKRFLLDEVLVNVDAGVMSCYFYKNAGDDLLYAGPVWDYDLTIVGESWSSADSKSLRAMRKNRGSNITAIWYEQLYKQDVFYKKVVEIYKEEMLPLLNTAVLQSSIDEYRKELELSFEMNKVRWKDNEYRAQGSTFEENAQYIVSFLGERKNFLNSVWIDNETYYTVYFKENEQGLFPAIYRSVRVGEVVTSPNVNIYDGMKDCVVSGWYYEGTDDLFDPNEPITDDIVLYAKVTKKALSLYNIKEIVKNYWSIAAFGAVLLIIPIFVIIDLKGRNLRKLNRKRGANHDSS